jgi:hypothetical protein
MLFQAETHVGHLQVDGSLRVQDVVEKIAVAVVASELGLESGLELERCSSGLQLCLDVLVARNRGHAAQVLHAIILNRLTVVVHQGLLFDIGLVWLCADGRVAVLVRGDSLA